MVSKASEDFPEPLTPVTTVIWFIGIENEMFLRLLTRAPRTSIASWVMLITIRATQTRKSRVSQTTHVTTMMTRLSVRERSRETANGGWQQRLAFGHLKRLSPRS